jgi:hypothetical protein
VEARTPSSYVVAPPSSGTGWLIQALSLLRDQAGRLLLIAVLMQLILGLVQLPLLGILVILAVPGLSAGILEAFHRARIGAAPAVSLLFRPLASDRLGRFVGMGGLVILVSVVCVSFVMGSTTEIDEALLVRLQQGDMAALEEIDPTFVTRLFAAFAISVAISGTLTFFSIPLVWFGNRKLGTALGEGLKALLVNWKPMLVLGLALMVVFLPVSLLTALLMQVALMEGFAGTIGMGLVMMLLLLFQLLLFGTQYCAFAEIFRLETGPQNAEPPSSDDQLVA